MRRILATLAISATALGVFVPAPAAVAGTCEHYYVDPTPGPDPYVFEEHYECNSCPIVPSVYVTGGDRVHFHRCIPDVG